MVLRAKSPTYASYHLPLLDRFVCTALNRFIGYSMSRAEPVKCRMADKNRLFAPPEPWDPDCFLHPDCILQTAPPAGVQIAPRLTDDFHTVPQAASQISGNRPPQPSSAEW